MNRISGKLKGLTALFVCVLMTLNTFGVVFGATENVDVKLLWTNSFSQDWTVVDENSKIFDVTAFEPGDEVVRYFDVQNTGDLAISYALDFVIEAGTDAELANIVDVYVKSDVSEDVTASEMTRLGTLAEILGEKNLSTGKISPKGETAVDGFATEARKLAVALKMQNTTEYFGKTLNGFKLRLTAAETDYTYNQTEKFEIKFPNTNEYLYRVGNGNTVALGSLFSAENVIGEVNAEISNISGNASGVYSCNTSDWTKGTIQFSGTGSVRVTVYDQSRKTAPTSLCLEIVDAVNATAAASATENNVVLLNDVNFSTIEVSNGYTLFGNGFTMTCTNDVRYYAMGVGFVTLNNGTLDNVKVIVPNFSYSILYNQNISESGNQHSYDSKSEVYGNVRSAVMMDGNSKIVNSYISGGRAAAYIRSGNHVIDGSTLCGGAAANIHLVSARSLTLRDTTLVQKPIQATVHDTSKKVMGLSIVAEYDGSAEGATAITFEGDFVQYAWGHEGYSDYVPSAGKAFINAAFSKTGYLHPITYADGTTADSLNLGIFYLPNEAGTPSEPTNLVDNRTNKAEIPYSFVAVSGAHIYSYANSNGTAEAFKNEPVYSSIAQGNIAGTAKYDDSAEGDIFKTYFDETKGIMSELTIDLDAVESYVFNFSDLKIMKYNQELSYTVKDSSGNSVDKSAVISFADTEIKEYVLTVTDDVSYNETGEIVRDKTVTYDYHIKIVATKTSIDPPTLEGSITNDTAYLVVKAKNDDWSCGIPASLDNINLRCYNKSTKAYETVNLGTAFPISSAGQLNGTNNYYTATSDMGTLTVTCGYIHDTKKVYGMPIGLTVGSAKKLYFTISSTNGYVSTSTASRTVTISYEFTDTNGGVWKKDITHQFTYADYSGGTQYSYSSFVKGTLEEAGGGCFAEGTAITLADGSQKAIENLTFSDEILVWDFFKGEYTATVPSLLIYDGVEDWKVINLNFSDGTTLRVIYEHGLFDIEENDYIYINKENVADYIGHMFIKTDGKIDETVTLDSYSITDEHIGCYTILTAFHNNCIANGVLTVTPPPVDGWYDYFEIGDGRKYDEQSMNDDIAEYGLYTYDDFDEYITYEEYLAFNGAYLKILVGKGYFTFEDILNQIKVFGVGNNGVMLMSDEVLEIVITSGENSISTATYGITALADGAAVENGSFVAEGDTVEVKITATGNAKSRYAKIILDGDVYYTAPLAESDEAVVTIKNAKGQTVIVEAVYGTHENESVSVIDLGEFTYTVDGASVTFSNTTKYDITDGFDVYVAIFGDDNCLMDVAVKSYEAFAAKTQDTFAPVLKETAGTIKTFIWKIGTMIPYFD